MERTIERIGNVVPKAGQISLSPQEREAILELSYLTIAADHKLAPEEIEAFRSIASRLREIAPDDPNAPPPSREEHRALSDRELDRMINRFADLLDRSSSVERLRALAADLARQDVRHLAYKIAYALALCDLETSDAEFEFDLDVIEALGLRHEESEELADEVMRVFNDDLPG